jgi:N-acetylneuraminate synthase
MDWSAWFESAKSTTGVSHIPFIAEIGINHNGNLNIAKELMIQAKSAGCDAVKFQKRTIDLVYTKEFLDSPRESVWGNTQREQKLGLEFGSSDYKEIDRFAAELGLSWTASAWDSPSLKFIENFEPQFHKVASAFATNSSFLNEVADLRRLTFVSTGMTTLEDIDNIVRIFSDKSCPLVLLHCVATYPASSESLNLRVIETLRDRYPQIPIGYSGHEASVSPTIVAVSLGACVVERHITLDRSMYGSDQSASLEPAGFRELIGAIAKVPLVKGDGIKKYEKGEKETAAKLRYWE